MPSTTTFWEQVTRDLKRDEGWRGTEYLDSVGVKTIGYGCNVEAHRGLIEQLTGRPYDGTLLRSEGAKILAHQIDSHWHDLTEALPWVEASPDGVQRVLLNMAFNLGVPGLLKFKETLALIRHGAYVAASDRLLSLPYAKQVPSRAKRLALILRGVL
jgi:lysozyme